MRKLVIDYHRANIAGFTSDFIKETVYHELCTNWYTDFVNAELAEIVAHSRATDQFNPSPIIALGEGGAYHIRHFLTDQRYDSYAGCQTLQKGGFSFCNSTMRELALFIFLLLSSIFLAAQKNVSGKNWAITVAPSVLPLPGSEKIGVQFGIGCQFNLRFAILGGITFNAGKRNDPDSSHISHLNKKYFRLNSELRYFLSDKSAGQGAYIGLQSSYTKRSFVSKYGYYYNYLPGDSVIYYDRAKISSPIITTSIQFGAVAPISKSFQVDWFLGFGARYINTTYSNIINPRESEKFVGTGGFRISLPSPAYYYPHVIYKVHTNFGVRLLYVFHHA